MKLLTVFIDGLKPESVKFMDFLSRFENKKRVRTELGYSNTCHSSIYTGVYPNKHLVWFLWKYSPITSPFKWLKKIRITSLPNNIYIKYICYKITSIFYGRKYNSAFKLPLLWYVPIKYWHYFDVTEKKFWNESYYSEKHSTIFEILQDNNVHYEIIGFSRNLHRSFELIKNHEFKKLVDWTYLFIGDIDPLSHEYGQDSPEVRKKLEKIDASIERIYNLYKNQFDNFYFLLFSDHGHTKIQGKINPYSFLESRGYSLERYIHFVDSNYLRFWFRDNKERKETIRALSALEDKGFVLTEEMLKRYKVNMPDNRYGDLIFYLDTPYAFDQGNIFVGGREWSDTGKYISFHGFLPDHPDMDGVLISNMKVTNKPYIKLEDIMPSILTIFNIKIPEYVDGDSIWK